MSRGMRIIVLVLVLALSAAACAGHAHKLTKWQYYQDDKHTAHCSGTDDECHYKSVKSCAKRSCVFEGHEFSTCLICGHTNIAGLTGHRAISSDAIVYNYITAPVGDIWVLVYEKPFGEDSDILYAVSAVFCDTGVAEAYDGDAIVSMTLPGLTDFVMYEADGMKNAVLPCEYTELNGMLKFRLEGACTLAFIKSV